MVWQIACMPDDGVVDLEMPVAVPGERADAVLRLHAEPLQHAHQPPRAAFGRPPRCSGGSRPRPVADTTSALP